MTFAALAGAANTYAVAIQLTTDADLQLHGGEDAVIERIRGRLLPYGALATPAGPVPTPTLCRCLIVQQDVTVAAGIAPVDYSSGAGLGRDNILWSRDILISGTTVLGNGTGLATETSTIQDSWFDVDVVAKRKIQAGYHIFLDFQTVDFSAAAGNEPVSFQLAGGLRLLMKRPR